MRYRFVASALVLGVLLTDAACTLVDGNNFRWVGSRFGRCIDNSHSRRPPLDLDASGDTNDTDVRLALRTRGVPGGFGGVYSENGRTIVRLTDPGQKAAAAHALRSVTELNPPDLERATFRQARWTFADLVMWAHYIARSPIAELRSSHIDDAGNRVVVGVQDRKHRKLAVRRLEAMNIPCHLVAVEIVGTIRLAKAARADTQRAVPSR